MPQDAGDALRAIVARALAEDVGPGDVTARTVIAPGARADGVLAARESGILSGLEVAGEVFRQVDAALHFDQRAADGDAVRAGTVLAAISGPARGLLSAERTALNFLQRLSGIATLTARYVASVSAAGVRILDTRKTTPGLRRLEKQAVVHGGGENHRLGLYDAVMIKDNHIAVAGGAARALDALRQNPPGVPVVMEIDRLADLPLALGGPVDQVLLDNFTPAQVANAVALISAARAAGGRRIAVEVSGGMRLEDVAAYAIAGVDYISVGALTHSAPALDIALDITPELA